MLSLCTALAWILLSKKLMQSRIVPSVVTAYTILAGTVMLVIWILGPMLANPWRATKLQPHLSLTSARPPGSRLPSAAWPARPPRLSCGTGASITFPLRAPASSSTLNRHSAPILGVKLLGEHLGPFAWVGGALILGAAIVLTTRGHEIPARHGPRIDPLHHYGTKVARRNAPKVGIVLVALCSR